VDHSDLTRKIEEKRAQLSEYILKAGLRLDNNLILKLSIELDELIACYNELCLTSCNAGQSWTEKEKEHGPKEPEGDGA